MDIVEELRKAALDCEDGERDPVTGESTWPKEETIEWVCADEIERLQEESKVNWVAFQKAADEIERLREALNIFMAVDPDKTSNWLYKREKAEALVKESLSTCNQSLQVRPWKCPIGKTDCNENCGSYGCGN